MRNRAIGACSRRASSANAASINSRRRGSSPAKPGATSAAMAGALNTPMARRIINAGTTQAIAHSTCKRGEPYAACAHAASAIKPTTLAPMTKRATRSDAMLAQFAIQGRAADAELPGRVADVALGLRQRGRDGLAFQRVERTVGGIGRQRGAAVVE